MAHFIGDNIFHTRIEKNLLKNFLNEKTEEIVTLTRNLTELYCFFYENATLLWKNGHKWIIQSIAHR